jgi:HEAT repeats
MNVMNRIIVTMLATMLAAVTATMLGPGCSRLTSKPTKQVQVRDSGPPVLTSMEMPPQSSAPSPMAIGSQAPGMISQAAYMRPLSNGQSVKPFSQWTEQDAATDALGRIGAAAVPALVGALRDPDPAVRLKAVEVLGRMGDDAQAAVPDLIRLLDDPDPNVSKAATRTLGRIGPAAKAAVPALMQKLFESPGATGSRE